MVGPPQSIARFASSIALAPLFALFTQYSLQVSSPILGERSSISPTQTFLGVGHEFLPGTRDP